MSGSDPALTIRDLRVRVPGLSPGAARQLGEAVARELAQNPPTPATARELSSVTLRVSGSAAHGSQSLAARIAASLRRTLE